MAGPLAKGKVPGDAEVVLAFGDELGIGDADRNDGSAEWTPVAAVVSSGLPLGRRCRRGFRSRVKGTPRSVPPPWAR